MELRLKALVVEDVATEVELTVRELRAANIHLDTRIIQDESGLRRALEEFHPDIVLSDFTLPQFDGMSALRIVREMAPDVPFIFVSGTIGEERAIEALKQGASDYVLKTNLRRLPQAVRQALDRRRLETERRQAEQLRIESERKLRNIIDTVKEWIWEIDQNGVIDFSSRYVKVMLGRESEALLGKPVFDHLHPEDRVKFLNQLALWRADTPTESAAVHRWMHRNGSTVWIESTASPRRDADGFITGHRIASRDITERRLRENMLARISRAHELSSKTNAAIIRIRERDPLLQEICRIAVESGSYDMARISLLDEDGETAKLVAWAGVTVRPFDTLDLSLSQEVEAGRSLAGLAMRTRRAVVCNNIEHDPRPVYLRRELVKHGFNSLVAMPLIVKDQTVGVLNLFSKQQNSFHGDEMEIIHDIVGDICYALEHFESETRLNHLAFYDSLTKLANSSLFSERLAQVLNVSGERGEKVVVILWDVEKLTDINNSFGRYVGDRLLQEIAQRVKKQGNLEPVTAHFGSGKFGCYIVTDVDQPDIPVLIARREAVIFGQPFEIDGQILHVSARGGATLYPRDAHETVELIRTAEAALNVAKTQREHLVVYTAQIMSRASERISLESRLRKAIEEEQFLLHYQPKVRASDGSIFGVEALIRWQDPEFGMIPPLKFIPVLEQSGMIVDVDRWVVRQALKDRQRWREAGIEPPQVAVNVTSPELNRDDFVTWFLDQVGTDHAGPGGCGIDIEITESMLMLDIESSIRKLNALREAGMAISIDDFGTGYSSLSYLARLPVDILKIDRSFVKGIVTDSDDLQIISTIVSLARSLDLITVAEGVETQEQFKLLRQMNCPVVQGYFFSKPLPEVELRPLLAQGAFPVPGNR